MLDQKTSDHISYEKERIRIKTKENTLFFQKTRKEDSESSQHNLNWQQNI